MKLIAITGGIGAGKSIVSRVLTAMGFPVYDCDSRAKSLMDNSMPIKRQIETMIAAEAILPDLTIDRQRLSQIVFNNREHLKTLNSIVHAAVRDDITAWANSLDRNIVFVETAILNESQIDRMIDGEWNVTAPLETRVNRVVKRNALTPDQVMARINAQSTAPVEGHYPISTIVNDDVTPILPQIESLLGEIRE